MPLSSWPSLRPRPPPTPCWGPRSVGRGPSLTWLLTHTPLQVSEHPRPLSPAPVQRFLTGSTLFSTLPLLLDKTQGDPRWGLCARLLGSGGQLCAHRKPLLVGPNPHASCPSSKGPACRARGGLIRTAHRQRADGSLRGTCTPTVFPAGEGGQCPSYMASRASKAAR